MYYVTLSVYSGKAWFQGDRMIKRGQKSRTEKITPGREARTPSPKKDLLTTALLNGGWVPGLSGGFQGIIRETV